MTARAVLALPFKIPTALARISWLGPIAVAHAVRRRLTEEWNGATPHLIALTYPRPAGFSAAPRDFRPVEADTGQALLRGVFSFGDEVIDVGLGGDPWDRATPSRRFAVDLHRCDWLRHLSANGAPGAREALRLILAWRDVFGRWNNFSWSGEVLERRVFNIACSLAALLEVADDTQTYELAELLARQARHLEGLTEPPERGAERAAVAALAGAALAGKAGEGLMKRALARLDRALPLAVLADGGHATRSPEAAMDLLLDLLSLDDALVQRGLAVSAEVGRAVDRLTAAMRFLTLADGRLACFQGGEAADAATVRAARAHDDAEAAAPPGRLAHSGYHRLSGGGVEVMIDTGAPAVGMFSTAACAQTLAVEIICGRDRLVTNTGWSPRAPAAQAQRLTDAGSTASLGKNSAGHPLGGFLARELGPRLVRAAGDVRVQREEAPVGIWLAASHDGYVAEFGLVHERRLFLDPKTSELRGEDRFDPQPGAQPQLVPYAVRFHLDPAATAVVARDHSSVLLRGPSDKGWWLRNDALDVRVEPSVHYVDGRPRPSSQVVLAGHLHADKGGRVRWKLTAAEG